MLDNKKDARHTCRASRKPMGIAQQLVPDSLTESETELTRLAEILAKDPAVIAKVKESEEDVKRGRILTSQQAMRRLRKKRRVLSPR